MKKKIHILAASGAILIGGSCSSFAATYDFTVAGGDFADLKTWQAPTLYPSLTELPGPDDYVRLASDSTFYMSQDMTVGEFSFGSKAVLDFASSGNHTLNVVGNAHHAFRAHNGTICGGVIDRDVKNMYWFQSSGYETTVTNGCVITNCNQFCVNVWGTSGGKLHLLGNSRLHAASLYLNNGLANAISSGTLLEVAEGSKVMLTNTAAYNSSDVNSKYGESGGNVLDIHGSGTTMDVSGFYINGYHSHSNVLRVADGASFEAKGLHVGYYENGAMTRGNRLIVDGGTVKTKGSGITAKGDGVMFSLTNATVEINGGSGACDFSSATNATIDIVDSVWRGGTFTTCPGLNLRAAGENTRFAVSEKFFGMGDVVHGTVGNRICFDDGFNWCPSLGYGYYFMETTTNCSLTVKNGAVFSAWHPDNNTNDKIVFGGSKIPNLGARNVIRVMSDGEIYGKEVWLTGVENHLIISNGLVHTVGRGEDDKISLGNNEWASGNRVTLQGSMPRIRAGKCYVGYGTTLRFEIPETGYSTGAVPIECPNGFHILDPQNTLNTFEVDVSRFVPESTTQLTLAQFGKDLTEDQKAWFKRAELPERYRIEIIDNRKVVLKARSAPKGFAVSIR
ncbi:MAG: hypothetical protein SPG40_00255 [Kiritimatiellia bacterium]|nr:hypothetical protein [Kiritimatiellia bacterium]